MGQANPPRQSLIPSHNIPAACNACLKVAARIAAPNTRAKLSQGIANPGSVLEVRNLFLTF